MCSMTTTWHRAGRLAPAWWKVPAAIWSKTAWSRPACAGRALAHQRSWICGPCASTAIGMHIGSFIDSNNITVCMEPHRQRHYRKPRYYRWQRDAAHRLWSHSNDFCCFVSFRIGRWKRIYTNSVLLSRRSKAFNFVGKQHHKVLTAGQIPTILVVAQIDLWFSDKQTMKH